MKNILIAIILLCVCINTKAQRIDTLNFHSHSFNAERTVYVHTPEYYHYQSSLVKLPVIYVLDGQHDWFVNPTLSTIKYLQYTHEIPEAIVVVIPLENRVEECLIKSIDGESLTLHRFITEELSQHLNNYHVNGFKLIIGHSFSASFALYSYLKGEGFYSAVIANSPLNKMEELVAALNESAQLENIFLSVGGSFQSKDIHHRKEYENLKEKNSDFFEGINTYEANTAAHNGVPLLANPVFLSELFYEYSIRLTKIAEVDMEYRLKKTPISIEDELVSIQMASVIMGKNFPLEVSQINGIASRYWASDLTNYAIEIYRLGVDLYPYYYEFHAYLGELLLESDKKQALYHLRTSLELLNEYESEMEYRDEIVKEIIEMIKNSQ